VARETIQTQTHHESITQQTALNKITLRGEIFERKTFPFSGKRKLHQKLKLPLDGASEIMMIFFGIFIFFQLNYRRSSSEREKY
jgi:hypothetical protein